ncbi:MAG TPA: hypothetical protein VK501_01455 [Baekduia sp.]|uniref:hypothetical protein n=1 Tax=Baekduia sp. TaxID=2600305 RepID=UPI002C41F4E7|nr:hypothetical protein [Baekduia sp.]HMJ32554.1 hypothetical protein [Baekduia sp.]
MALSPVARRRLVTIVPPLLVGLLALPFALRQNSWWEWTNAFWLLQRQAAHVAAHGVPTYFLHEDTGSFYPFNVFYGGFTVSVLAYPAALLGAWPVFVASVALAFVAGYLGIWWTARNLGLSRSLAVLPALTFVTTPYVVSEAYGRGAWAELVAVNGVAVMVGALTSMLWRPGRGRIRAPAALAGSAAVVAGTHNVTMLISALVLPFVVAALLPLIPPGVGVGGIARRLGGAVLAIGLGVGLTGAWLVPNLWLGRDTVIAQSALNVQPLALSVKFAHLPTLLSPWPMVPESNRDLRSAQVTAQPPVLAMAWVLVALGLVFWVRRRSPDRVAASAAGLVVVGLGLLLLTADPGWWLSFPPVLQTVQFTYRVIPYLAIVIALAMTVALIAIRRGPARRTMTVTLLGVVVAQAAMTAFMAVDTTASPQFPFVERPARHADVRVDHQPAAFSTPGPVPFQFRVLGHPIGPKAVKPARIDIADPVTSDAARLRGTGAVGDVLRTSVVWSRLVRIDGDVRLTGRTADGVAVVTVAHTDRAGKWSATVRPRCTVLCAEALTGDAPWPLLAGWLLTAVSVLTLAGAGLVALRRARHRTAVPETAPDRADTPMPTLEASAR